MESDSLFTKCKGCKRPISVAVDRCAYCGKRRSTITGWQWAGAFLVLVVIISASNSPSSPDAVSVAPAPAADKSASLLSEVDLVFDWKKQGFGSIMEADFTVKNQSAADIKDITIRCDYFAKSQTRIDHSERTIFDVVPARSSKSFPKFNMGFMSDQTYQAACKITSVKPAKET